jgi:hypothetical protein
MVFFQNNLKFEVKKRKLQDRTNICFEYPQSNGRVFRTCLPFLENPNIQEKGSANLSDYDIIGRNGQIFTHTGSKSRTFDVNFNLSLMHYIEMDQKDGISDKFKRNFLLFMNDQASQEDLFKLRRTADKNKARLDQISKELDFDPLNAELENERQELMGKQLDSIFEEDDITGDPDIKKGKGYNHAENERNHYAQALGAAIGQADALVGAESVANVLNAFGGNFTGAGILKSLELETTEAALQRLDESINMIIFYINLVRSSVMNRSNNTTYGPPIVRLNHGTMYNNIPCLVQGYDISMVEEAGYEVHTLTPKRLEVKMKLIECRTGNFGAYEPGRWLTGDNVTGWESVISDNAIDPHNGDHEVQF